LFLPIAAVILFFKTSAFTVLLFSIHAGEASNEINASLLFAFTVKITFSNLLAETLALSSNEPFMSSNLVQ